MRFLLSLLLVSVAGGSVMLACSSSTSSGDTSCASNPFSCPAGQTCSAKDATGAFACITSGAGAKGAACQNTPGSTMCGDGLVCLQLSAAGGSCASYCDNTGAAHPCAAGETCRQAALAGTSTTFFVCAGGTKPADDSGAPDTGAADAAGE